MTTFYYIHPESSSAFSSTDSPETVLPGDGCVMEVSRDEYLRACEDWGIDPDETECRYCANTGFFYGDRDLGIFCGCQHGRTFSNLFKDLLG